jgi:uncharacterized protein (TIGR02466 family)
MSETKLVSAARDLWPTRIWTFDFSSAESLREGWIADLVKKRESDPKAKPAFSNRQGWNSNKEIFKDEVYAPLKTFANSAFAEAFRQMKPMNDFKFRLEAWANVHDHGGFNQAHFHRNTLLSGCYYLTVPGGAGPIVFKEPRPGANLSGFSGKGINCCDDFKFQPKEGQLIIFPNWLEHYVEINASEASRASIAMNAIPVAVVK